MLQQGFSLLWHLFLWLKIKIGELKEVHSQGIISKKEYGKIINTGKSILKRLKKKRE